MRRYWFYFGIILILIGLPFSRAFISFGQAALALTFLIDRNFVSKVKKLITNKAFLASILFYIVLIFGALYSENKEETYSELRTRIPLILFPLVFASEPPISHKVFRRLVLVFSSSGSLSLTYSLFLYFSKDLGDFRDAFIFNSHIRISLELVLSIVFLLYLTFRKNHCFSKYRVLFILLALYLAWAMLSLELLSGIIVMFILSIVLIIRLVASNTNPVVIRTTIVLSLLAIIGSFVFINSAINSYTKVAAIEELELEKLSPYGNLYFHNPSDFQIENGSYIGIYIQWQEMEQEWNKRSNINFNSKDNRGQNLKYTLLRYLNSKHLRKDADGVNVLSSQDIINIENGVANVEYANKFSFRKRIYKLLWEWDSYKRGNKNAGHTIIQRLELWHTSSSIINENFIFGIGTGDIKRELNKKFIENNSALANSGLKSHNEFVSVLLSVGIVGLIVFLFSMFYPPFVLGTWRNPLFIYFFIILFVSMFWEDTLGTMVGATLFAFFNAIYLFGLEAMDNTNPTDIQ